MKTLLRVLKGFAFGLLSLLSLLTLILLLVIQWPSLLINDQTLKWTASYLERNQDIRLRWEGFSFDVESPAFMRKRLAFHFKGLCIQMAGIDGCAPGLSARAAVSLGSWPPKITELGPVSANVSRLKIELGNGPGNGRDEKAQRQEPKSLQTGEPTWLPRWLEDAKLNPVAIVARNVEFTVDQATFRGAVDAKGVWVDNNRKWRLLVSTHATLPDRSQAQAHARVEGTEATSLRYWLSGQYKRDKIRILTGAHGRITPEAIEATVEATAYGLHADVPKAELRDCRAKLALAGSERLPGRLRLRCPVWTRVNIPPETTFGFLVPSDLGALVQADLRMSEIFPVPEAHFEGKVSLHLEPVLTPLFKGEGDVSSEVLGVPARFTDGEFSATTELGLAVEVPRFERLVEHFSKGGWAIPAPLHVLSGASRAEVRGRIDLREGALPMRFMTRLQSSTQKVFLNGTGEARMKRWTPTPQGHLDLDLMLTELQLELPRLDRNAPPSFLPDSRIRPIAEEAKERRQAGPPDITFQIRIHTQERPVRLISNLAVSPVPLELDVTYVDRGKEPVLSGWVRVNSFPVNFFNQKGEVERISIQLTPKTGNSKLDGSIRIDRADYIFRILLTATLGRPKYKLISEPPLPEDQIYAVLLTGKDVSELGGEEAGSVSDIRSALGSGIGLASLLVLGSTPIESITYDEASRVARANVKIAEGMSVNVGANLEEGSLSQVGIRKRLGPHWVIETEVDRPTTWGEQNLSTYLKWIVRY